MKIDVIGADRLAPEHAAAWSELQQGDPALGSPFFRPEYIRAVAAVRSDVEVAILTDEDGPAGFFPYQRQGRNVARPVGDTFSDFQGVVARRGFSFDARQLLRGCGLAAWHCNNLIASQEPFRPYHCVTEPSAHLDLSAGYEAYLAGQLEAHRSWFDHLQRKRRQAERDCGTVRFVADATDRDAFAKLIQWKSRQYRETKGVNVLSFDWTVPMLERILAERGAAFSGVLSVLYLRDEPAAILLGMRSLGVLHAWMTAYNRDFSKYSTGLLLFLELAKAALPLGIRRIDLGRGPEDFKRHFMSGATDVVEGCVDLRRLAGSIHQRWLRTRAWIRASRLRRPARYVARTARAWLGYNQ